MAQNYKYLTLPDNPVGTLKLISDNMMKLADQEGSIVQMPRDPLVSDGRSSGYYQFSRWLNTVSKSLFICLDDNNPYAVWQPMNKLAADASPSLSGDLQTGNYTVWANRITSDTGLNIDATSNIQLANYNTGGVGAWFVKIPTISNTGPTTFYVYYGKAGASDTQSPNSVWDAGFKAVNHLDESVSESVDNFRDSTANVNHAFLNGAGACFVSEGHLFERSVGIGVNECGPCGIMSALSANNLDNVNTISASMWVNPLGYTAWARFLERSYESSFRFSYCDIANPGAIGLSLSTNLIMTPNDTLPLNVWTHVGFTYNSAGGANNAKIYVNGSVAAQGTHVGPLLADSYPLGIGNTPHYSNSNSVFHGMIEEVRYSTTERSAAWMNFEYWNMGSDSHEITVGAEEVTSAIAGYSYRRQITINHTNVAAALSNFPLYVRLDRIIQHNKVRADGYDVVFAGSNGTTLLSFERMFWSPPNYLVQLNDNNDINKSIVNVGNLTSTAPVLNIWSNSAGNDLTISANSLILNGSTIPASDGTIYQTLKCDGSGGLSWSSDIAIPVGSIWFWGSDTPPDGYLLCDGSSVSTATYANLYNVIGYSYGGSGASFTLPNFKQRMAVHPDGTTEFPTITAGSNKYGGVTVVTLDANTCPPHWHYGTGGTGSVTAGCVNGSGGTGKVTAAAGGGGSHNNMPPYCVTQYIIKY